MSNRSDKLGTQPIGSLLIEQAVPASIGILIMSIYGIVDTIFVGKWVGPLAIGAITVVMPISFLISSVGMAIGVGGGSMIARAMGAHDEKRASLTFGNQVSLTLLLALVFVLLGFFAQDYLLMAFGGRGDLLEPSKEYFQILLIGVPFLAWAMMTNNVIRAEGKPRIAMMVMIVPALVNLVLDPIFIVVFEWGLAGAAWATTLSYIASALYSAWFFWKGSSELSFRLDDLRLRWPIVGEIFSIGGVTLARQGTISLLSIVLNNALFSYGGEMGVSVYGIINRMMMFANFPVLGVTQGFLPIAGYNYGAKLHARVKEVLYRAIAYGTGLALIIFTGIMLA
ncbi:MAG: MATE family efflux transporter, partial [Bacteroidota bacterium]